MLIAANPQYSLRMRELREVYDCVFVDQADLFSEKDNRNMVTVAEPKFRPDAGEVDVRSFRAEEPFGYEGILRASNKLVRYLKSWGFLNKHSSEKQFQDDIQYMVSRGAIPHVDSFNREWLNSLFWVYVLQTSKADLLFPNLGISVPLVAGQMLVFDPGQPHGVVKSGKDRYAEEDFASARSTQLYLAGHISYDLKFFQELGLETREAVLEKSQMLDLGPSAVCEETGKVIVSRL